MHRCSSCDPKKKEGERKIERIRKKREERGEICGCGVKIKEREGD
jgi:hypothetical protein